jgi:hypothetical protein
MKKTITNIFLQVTESISKVITEKYVAPQKLQPVPVHISRQGLVSNTRATIIK